MKEEKQYIIRTLGELNEIDEKAFSRLESISFKLPNGEQVNPIAESQALRILELRKRTYLECNTRFKDLLYWRQLVFLPLYFPFFMLAYVEDSVLKKQTKKESYRQFCELRDKINYAYKMPINYRSYPVLEERIMRD